MNATLQTERLLLRLCTVRISCEGAGGRLGLVETRWLSHRNLKSKFGVKILLLWLIHITKR